MSSLFKHRVAFLAAFVVAAAAGVVWAQGNGGSGPYPGPGGFPGMSGGPGVSALPPGGSVRVKVSLSDGQIVELNAASVDIQFSSGGVLRATDSGALPVALSVAAQPGYQPAPTIFDATPAPGATPTPATTPPSTTLETLPGESNGQSAAPSTSQFGNGQQR